MKGVLTLASCIVLALVTPLLAAEPDKAQVDSMRKALSKYEDWQAAVRDLYFSTEGCVHYDGMKMAGHMDYPKGTMGVHFVNLTVTGEPDPNKPNVLVYEPTGDNLRLVAAEWLVPYKPGLKRPTLLGQDFQGPMEGHYPLINKEFIHYDLHAWLVDNPNGMFSPTNPKVTCDKAEFPMLEQPTKMMPE